jgi:hypothetical protein
MRRVYLIFLILFMAGFYLNGCKEKQEAVISGKPSSEATATFERSKVIPNIHGGHIDVAEPMKAPVTTKIHLGGWAADLQKKVPAESIIIVADGKQILFSPLMGIERNDVADFNKSNDLLKSGWNGMLPASTLGRGKHRLELYAVLDGGRLVHLNYKDKGYSFEIEVVD